MFTDISCIREDASFHGETWNITVRWHSMYAEIQMASPVSLEPPRIDSLATVFYGNNNNNNAKGEKQRRIP